MQMSQDVRHHRADLRLGEHSPHRAELEAFY